MNRLSKIAVAVLIPVGIVGGYLATGFYFVPAWLQHNLPMLIKKETGLDSNLGSATFNPVTFQLLLHQFELQKIIRFDDLNVQVNLHESLVTKSLVIEKVTLNKPFFQLKKQKNGALNIMELLPKSNSPPQKNASDIFPLTLKHFALSQGVITWQDGAIHEEITPLNFTLENFSTQNSTTAKFNLNALLKSGGELTMTGNFQFSLFASTGQFSLTHLPLSHLFAVFAPEKVNPQGDGKLNAEYRVTFNQKTPQIVFENGSMSLTNLSYQDNFKLQKLTVDNWNFDSTTQLVQFKTLVLDKFYLAQGQAQFNLSNFTFSDFTFDLQNQNLQTATIAFHDAELFDTTQHTLLFKLPQLDVKNLAFNLKKKTVAIRSLQAKNADFRAWLNPSGELNYQTLLPEDGTQVAEENSGSSEAFWGIKIDSVELNDFSAVFEDKTLPKPLTISIKPLSLKLTELNNASGSKLPFELNTGINDTGSLHLKGDASLNPLAAQSDIALNALGLEKFQSYLDKFAHLDLIKGIFNLDGKLDVARGDQGELDIKFKGNTGIARLITRDQIQNKDLLKWDNLTLKNVEADVLAQRYSASALLLDKPYARVVIGKDKRLNFADILVKEKPAASRSKTKEIPNKKSRNCQENKGMCFRLDKVQISNGASSFADLSMILPFSAEIRGLEGGASGISSAHESTIIVTLKGNAYDLAPVDIKSKIKPFIGDYQAILNFRGMPLPLMSAYMAEFAGYKLEKGKMSIDMNYDVKNGELTASNNLLIEQFELGQKIENPHAIKAPLDLAIALLKDVNGIINLDVPITGSLNDPHFDFAGIVGDALLNVITKVITSPFQAIADLLGTDDDLSTIQFAAGESELNDWQKQKLEGLAKVLHDREVLKLEIKGAAFQKQDWLVLRETALIDRLKTLKAEEFNRKNDRKIRPEYVELDDADTQRLLAQEFKVKFPQLVKKSFLGNFELVKPEMGEFYNVARQTLAQALPVEQKRLIKLAAARARAIAKYIVQQGGVPNERVFILDTVIDPVRENDEINALLSLKVD